MTIFILHGAKGGAGRTVSSVFLAAGLAAIGHRLLHLQIAMSNRPPIIALAESVPFKTTWLPEEHADADAIRQIIAFHSDCTTVVIDLPKRYGWEVILHDLDATALFPMRYARWELQAAFYDYREFVAFRRTIEQRKSSISPETCRALLLPVGWPPTAIHDRYDAVTSQFDEAIRSGGPLPRILHPGVPELQQEEIHELMNGSTFHCRDRVRVAAIETAKAAQASLVRRGPTPVS